uniref:ARAD1C18502p n=1 Tax=Blastobotrys adeninivorans TaxID=409370 RepID=A0A060T1S6_BLAAD
MSDTSSSVSSLESDASLVDQNGSDMYLQALFGYLDPKHYGIATSYLRVIQYSEDSTDFWRKLRHFVRFASKYQSLLNEDLVLVIQDGVKVWGQINCYLKKRELKYKYLVGPANCFVVTMLSPLHKFASQNIPRDLLLESGLNLLADTGGSYEIYLQLHSMLEICSNAFGVPHSISKAKNRDGLGMKSPDNSAFPQYLPLIRVIQGAPIIPTFMIETGASDQSVKVEIDCMSTILGSNFMVESVLGIDIHMNHNSQKLKSIGFIVFDVSVSAMLDLYNSLSDDYEKALTSIVLKRKAEFKLDEVRAIRQLKECIEDNGDYKSVCRKIAKQYRQRMKHDLMRDLDTPGRPNKNHTRNTLKRFGFKTTELISEEKHYQDVIDLCDKATSIYSVQELLDRKMVRKADSFVVQRLYRRRTVQNVTYRDQHDLILPGTALSSTHWWRQNKVVLPSTVLKRFLYEMSLHCSRSNLEWCKVHLETPWEYLRQDAHVPVALLNSPDGVPEEAALRHLKRLYDDDPQRCPLIRTEVEHWTTEAIELQLSEWGVTANGSRHTLTIKFLYKHTESALRVSTTQSSAFSSSIYCLEKESERVKLDSDNPYQEGLPRNVARCLTMQTKSKRKKLRKLLLKDELEKVLLEINDDVLALEGLSELFQQDMPAVRFILSGRGAFYFLRTRAAVLNRSSALDPLVIW